jgi:hypothetical protein
MSFELVWMPSLLTRLAFTWQSESLSLPRGKTIMSPGKTTFPTFGFAYWIAFLLIRWISAIASKESPYLTL